MTFRLHAERVLRGTPPQTFSFYDGSAIEGQPYDGVSRNTFNNHKDADFWATGGLGGRSSLASSCTIKPKFEKGALYLVFLDKPYHEKGFEKIESDDDLWLKVVELSISRAAPLK